MVHNACREAEETLDTTDGATNAPIDRPQGCMNQKQALVVMTEGDMQLCMRYMGAAGGMEAAKLSLYPFASEILDNMKVC